MRSSSLTSALLPSLAVALAPPSEPRQEGPGFLALPFTRSRSIRSAPRLSARQDVDVPLYNVTTISYLVELSIGTPGQTVRVAIDTGSSELWVNPNCKTVNTQDEYQDCVTDGQYNPNQSSTFRDLESRSSITYGIGKVQIAYVADNVALPNSTIDLKNIQFGAAIATQDLSEGILGLSYGNHSNPRALEYANFVDQLLMQGVTKSRAFSVALGNQDLDDGGVLVLGGLDTGKFSGSLVSVPILGPQLGEALPRYWVEMQSLGSTINGKTNTYSNSNMAVVLDTGSTLCSLPTNIIKDMVKDTNAQVDSQGDVVVKCSIGKNNASFNFAFKGITINIPWSEFLLPVSGSSTECVLGVTPSDSVVLLGDSFLRSTYVVFDQDHGEISMAPWADCGSKQQSIGSGAVGNVQGACNLSSSTNTTGHNSAPGFHVPGWVTLGSLATVSFLFTCF